ncbi:CA174 protein, partial [Urocolius indicus]|nr:CA174 protein [Urocolius indicus]
SSSHKASDRGPSKRRRCEVSSLVKSEGLACGKGNLAVSGETATTSDGDQPSEDPGDLNTVQQKKGESVPETNEEKQGKEREVSLMPCVVKSSSAPSKMDSGDNLPSPVCNAEESSCESALSDGSSCEGAAPLNKPIQDSSAFLDEDSNQPMPVACFFGDVEFLQDLPAVALPSTTMSRRECRKLHFIAKEDEEEEEEDV